MRRETWHLLIHQIPAHPLYLRARIRALLARSGAVALKKSVYALPAREGSLARLRRVAEEIRACGGEAFVCETRFVDAKDETVLVDAFRAERAGDYFELGRAAEALYPSARGGPPAASRAAILRLMRRLHWIASVDFFEAEGRANAEARIGRLERPLGSGGRSRGRRHAAADAAWVGRTWVTRKGVHVDRIACAWLIRRFLDPAARFRFTATPGAFGPGGSGFDIPGGEFSHEEGGCSFETLLRKSGRGDPALARIAGMVHDIDIKDGKFGFPETAGVEQLLTGMLASHPDDASRLERGATFFDDLYRSLQKKPRVSLPQGAALVRRPGRGAR